MDSPLEEDECPALYLIDSVRFVLSSIEIS